MTVDWKGYVDHRVFVAGEAGWDADYVSGEPIVGLLKYLGMRPKSRVLDFGCGSLRVGRWLIPYLEKGKYFGIDPNLWLVEMGRLEEVREEVWERKAPRFSDEGSHDLTVFAPAKFDVVLAAAVLIHSSHRQIEAFINSLPDTLKKGGFVLAETRTAGPDYERDEWTYPRSGCHAMSCFIDRAPAEFKVEQLDKQPFPGTWFTIKWK